MPGRQSLPPGQPSCSPQRARQDEGLCGGRAGSVGERGLRGALCGGGQAEEDARAVVRVLGAAEGRPQSDEPGRAPSVGSGRAERVELWGCESGAGAGGWGRGRASGGAGAGAGGGGSRSGRPRARPRGASGQLLLGQGLLPGLPRG